MAIELLGADYHRNGVGGAGFYTALFIDPAENPGHTFLATMFVDYICSRCGGTGEYQGKKIDGSHHKCEYCAGTGEVTPTYVEHTAVLDVNMAASGNIYMNGEYNEQGCLISAGGNAWRGADYYSAELLPLIKAWLEQSRKNVDLHFKLKEEKEAS